MGTSEKNSKRRRNDDDDDEKHTIHESETIYSPDENSLEEDDKPKKKKIRRRMNDCERWIEMFNHLVDYKTKFNSTSVPQRYVSDHHLGKWVNNQRTAYKQRNHSSVNR